MSTSDILLLLSYSVPFDSPIRTCERRKRWTSKCLQSYTRCLPHPHTGVRACTGSTRRPQDHWEPHQKSRQRDISPESNYKPQSMSSCRSCIRNARSPRSMILLPPLVRRYAYSCSCLLVHIHCRPTPCPQDSNNLARQMSRHIHDPLPRMYDDSHTVATLDRFHIPDARTHRGQRKQM